ncbi:hypothetical protein JKF63_02023 [Porcisia hertigi]|uniref:Uncharacterized protein n=1 Tax=Porcisia hertigi TaxID=2761500 RepID=A0A836HKS6_9TRYP|nr:hypothetical protein JKF63_02023 [Porcisia hertigi]
MGLSRRCADMLSVSATVVCGGEPFASSTADRCRPNWSAPILTTGARPHFSLFTPPKESTCIFHLGGWRRMPSLAAATRARHITFVSKKNGAPASAHRQEWYRRQLDAQTLCSVDVVPLIQRTQRHRILSFSKKHGRTLSRRCQTAAISDIFLSCCAAPLFQESALLSIFKQLTADQQCEIISLAIMSAIPFSKPQLCNFVAEALHSDLFTPAHWVRLVTGLPGNIDVYSLPWTRIMERVLCSSEVPFSFNDDACVFIARVLGFMEKQGTPSRTIVQCLEMCGLCYEACAYASSSSNFLSPPTRLTSDGGWGYVNLIYSMCALPEPPIQGFAAVCRGMPSVLRHYSKLVLLQSIVQKWGVTDNGANDRWRRFAEVFMTTIEAASAVHFLFGKGNAVTVRFLLPHCHTQQQIVTLMRYIPHASVDLTLAALRRSTELRSTHRSLARVGLTHRETQQNVQLDFLAKAESFYTAFSECPAPQGTAVGIFPRTLRLGFLDLDVLHRCLREALPTAALARGHRSLAYLLAAVPASAVEHVVNFVGTLDSDALSWWASLYTEARNFEGVFAVLGVTAARGCLPHMGVLVALLEALRDDHHCFVRAVALLQELFPQVLDTVFRAFVERTATNLTHTTSLPDSTKQAMQLFSALPVIGSIYAAAGASDTSATDDAMVTVASHVTRPRLTENRKIVIPLHVGAIEGLIAASAKLDYDVLVTVDVESECGEWCGSWSSTHERDPQP